MAAVSHRESDPILPNADRNTAAHSNAKRIHFGRQQTRASVVDVTPTILYFLGLPIGRDMDGYARTDLFQRSFTDERPITFIPTYDR